MLEFLNNIQLEVVEEVKAERTSRKQELNPTNGADIRLFKDGRVYPSEELIEEYDLNYVNKGADTGNGFDVFSTINWNFYPKDVTQHAVLIAVVNKSKAKVDMFSTTRYNDDNTPISNVKDQGSSTFGKELIEMLSASYNVPTNELFGDNNYVDLKIGRGQVVKSPDDIYYIPKKVTKGQNAGSIEHIRRENLVLNPLVVYTREMEEAYNAEQFTTNEDNVTPGDVISE